MKRILVILSQYVNKLSLDFKYQLNKHFPTEKDGRLQQHLGAFNMLMSLIDI